MAYSACPLLGVLRRELTVLVSLVCAYWPRLSGLLLAATTVTWILLIWDSLLAGSGPDDQSHGVLWPVRYTWNIGGTLPPGFCTSATRCSTPPLLPATLPTESPYTWRTKV